jgi:uncharacterized protein (TIGR02001 family)
MKLTQGLAALVLLASASIAQAEITGNASVVSDYNWRGITQTAGDPAIQGGLDWTHDSGFYAGVWGSNVDFGDCCDENLETDVYFGWAGGEDITYNVGLVYYLYPNADGLNYPEIYGSLGWKWLTGKISYSNDFGNVGESAYYIEGNTNWELPAKFALQAHLGYSDGSAIETVYGESSYFDWSVGVTYPLGNFTLWLKYADGSDLKSLDGTPGDVSSSEGVAIFSIATTFPWSKE